MRILVIEDNEKHLNDARQYSQTLTGCEVDFATTLAEALALLEENSYDGVISDVFFPAETGASAETYENALTINAKLIEMDIHHVFNTSGNHHGAKYQGFLHQTPKFRGNDGVYDNIYSAPWPLGILGTGMVIEAYPDDSNGDKDTKQWQAAFRYILLVHALRAQPDGGCSVLSAPDPDEEPEPGPHGMERPALGSTKLTGFPYGEYGQLTGRFEDCSHPFVTEIFQSYNA